MKKFEMIPILFLLCSTGIVSTMVLHEELTSEEMMNIFHTSNKDSLPEYDLVKIVMPKRQKRSSFPTTRVLLEAFGKKIDLLLNPVDGVLAGYNMPIYQAIYDGRRTRLSNYNHDMRMMRTIREKMYQDVEQAASVIISTNNKNEKKITGTIGKNQYVIKPVPDRFLTMARRHRRSVDGIPESQDNYLRDHIVFKSTIALNNSQIYKTLERSYERVGRSKRATRGQIPDIVYPEILVVVHYSLFKILGKNIWKAVPYLLNFWNSVDLRFRSLDGPKFRLNIAGIVFDTEGRALKYMEEQKISASQIKFYEAQQASKYFWYELNDQIPTETYDVLVTMSADSFCYSNGACGSLGMYSNMSFNNSIFHGKGNIGEKILAFGSAHAALPRCLFSYIQPEMKYTISVLYSEKSLATIQGACKIDHENRLMEKVSLVSDRGGYSGVIVAAHELGHLFGAYHDNDKNRNSLNQCIREDESAIMYSYSKASTIDQFLDWSRCSRRDIKLFIRDGNSDCLFNKPIVKMTLPRYLPGMFMSTDRQCNLIYGTKTCKFQGKGGICHALYCELPNSKNGCYIAFHGAADGTPCDDRHFCLKGKCVDHEKISPQ